MNKNIPAVTQLMVDASRHDTPVTDLLRQAKMIASKLDQKEFLVWIDKELKGYEGCQISDLPKYRVLVGELETHNPYHGWQTVQFATADLRRRLTVAPINQAIGPIEESSNAVKNRAKGLSLTLSPEQLQMLHEILPSAHEIRLSIPANGPVGILDAVRTILFDWAVDLDNAGILGENLHFTQTQKLEAKPVTQTIIAQTIGHIGNTSDQATVTINQTTVLDQKKIEEIITEIEKHMGALPKELQPDVSLKLTEIHSELKKPEKNQNKGLISESLQSIRHICEHAAGSLIAHGISSYIAAHIQ